MLDKKIEKALNVQLNAELYSAYLYLSMAAYFESLSLPGFANWVTVQAQEEQFHAMKFYGFLNDRGGRVTLQAIEGPPVEWESPLEVFKAVLAHERKVTGLINELVNISAEKKDHASGVFLQWFVNEQVEEEKSAQDVVSKLKLAKNDAGAAFMMDQELGQRVYTPPATEGDA